ncbi:MAG: hypothetical protein JNL18_02810 [Planctomycetaceae bacterium]|nr:hypothetical protein [Planctomycetaceae bacterium]
MKHFLTILLAIGILVTATPSYLFARGGRGGGGGGGGRGGGGGGMHGGGGFSPSGGSRPAPRPAPRPSTGGGQAASRPAQSRPAASRPAGPQAGARPAGAGNVGAAGQRPAGGPAAANRPAAGRPTPGQLNNFLDIPGPATGAVGTARPGAARPGAGGAVAGGAAADFLQGGGKQLAAGAAGGAAVGAAANRSRVDAGRPGTPGDNLSQNRPGRIEDRGERQGERDQRRDEIRDQYNEHNPGDFWQENPGWTAWAITRPFAWATWGSVGSWCGYSGEPTSYSYGEAVYYSGDQVYSGDQPIATTEEYADQAAAIASSAPAEAPASSDWLPLGVFALTQDGQATGAPPSLYLQLAISKQGVISGTLKNTLTGKVQSIEGMADKQSQRVAWTVADQERPIMETGLENLTQDSAPALIHFADGQTQQWLMVRIPEPKQ